MKLVMSGKYQVQLTDERNQEFEVLFHGPKDSHYEGVSLVFSPLSADLAMI